LRLIANPLFDRSEKVKYIGKGILAVLIAVTLLVAIAAFQTGVPAAAVTTGIYTYDPEHDQPSQLIVENRLETVLLVTLQQQIARDGTYP
jgi:FlaG/FlaF family flagellin (archaellin)